MPSVNNFTSTNHQVKLSLPDVFTKYHRSQVSCNLQFISQSYRPLGHTSISYLEPHNSEVKGPSTSWSLQNVWSTEAKFPYFSNGVVLFDELEQVGNVPAAVLPTAS